MKEKAELRDQLVNEQSQVGENQKCNCVNEEKKSIQDDLSHLQVAKKENLVITWIFL